MPAIELLAESRDGTTRTDDRPRIHRWAESRAYAPTREALMAAFAKGWRRE
jgi:hypothetical protein